MADVIEVERPQVEGLWKSAVFAQPARPLSDAPIEVLGYGHGSSGGLLGVFEYLTCPRLKDGKQGSDTAQFVQDLRGRRTPPGLDEKPPLAPGRVQVTILPLPAPAVAQPRRTILDVVDEIQAAQQARGYHRSVEEMEADEGQRRAEEDAYEERASGVATGW